MIEAVLELLSNPVVQAALQQAWIDSKPRLVGGTEQGGFVVRVESGAYTVHRWPAGRENLIEPPAHRDCRFESLPIVASFHTHPNTGRDYRQEPSRMDVTSIRNDHDLKGPQFLGELVISNRLVYLVQPSGRVAAIGSTDEIL